MKPNKHSDADLQGIGYAWGIANLDNLNPRRKGWLDVAADNCAKDMKAPRCWALLRGIKAATRCPNPFITDRELRA